MTPDAHLAAAYRLFGVRNRVELAAAINGHPVVPPGLPRLPRTFLRVPGLNCWERLIIIRASHIVASKTA